MEDPFVEERKEYASTIEDLLKKLTESEQDRVIAVERMQDAEERRRFAENDLRDQIEKANAFEHRYYAEWESRKAIEEELAHFKAESKKGDAGDYGGRIGEASVIGRWKSRVHMDCTYIWIGCMVLVILESIAYYSRCR